METVEATSEAVVCALSEDDKRVRRQELRVGIGALITRARETEDGFDLGFAPRAGDMLRDFVAFESRCCGFMTYTIDDRDEGVVWLRMTGPRGAKEFIRGWLPEGILDVADGRPS